MFPSSDSGEKPQSKLFYNDGAYWAVLKGPNGVAIYERSGNSWIRGTFPNAVLTASGNCDVKWDGTTLFVLVYGGGAKLFQYSYVASSRSYSLASGFPVSLPNPSGSETMVLDEDSTGRLWTTAEGGGNVNVYYSTSADHRSWSSTPIVLQTGINADDISSVIAFGGNKIGVFWSDQNRWDFGFRVHHDGDAPNVWDAKEAVYAGSRHSDDHIHLAFDSSGRVYAVTKDASDKFAVHRRGVNGGWTTKTDIAGGSGTRPIIMVAEADAKVYVLYTRWGVSPNRIEYRVANISDLVFGNQTIFISSSSNMNNVTGIKQILPAGNLIAVSSNGSRCLWNGFGSPPSGTQPPPPGAPQSLTALLQGSSPQVTALQWQAPSIGSPAGYNVYRQLTGGAAQKLNAALVLATSYTDSNLVAGSLCYSVTAVDGSAQESGSPPAACVNVLGPPPGAPGNLTASRGTIGGGSSSGAAAYACDEGSGQTLGDATGHGHTGQLGTTATADAQDPIWMSGVTAGALQLDGQDDRVLIADAADLQMAGSFTLEAWVKHAAGGSGDCIVSKGNSQHRNFWMLLDSSGHVSFRWETSDGTNHGGSLSAKAILDASWHHVACVYDMAARQDRIYIDGALDRTTTDSGLPTTSTDPVVIGARMSGASFIDPFLGGIDLVRISSGAIYSANFAPPTSFGGGAPQDVVQLAWSAPAGGSAAASYRVYRKVDAGAFTLLNSNPVTGTSYTDTSPPASGTLCYQVSAVNAASQEGPASAAACATTGPAALAQAAAAEVQNRPALELGAQPNPFNPATAVSFRLPDRRPVLLQIFDVRGRRVSTLVDETLPAGRHVVAWAGRSDEGAPVASGLYVAVLRAGDLQQRQKLILLK